MAESIFLFGEQDYIKISRVQSYIQALLVLSQFIQEKSHLRTLQEHNVLDPNN